MTTTTNRDRMAKFFADAALEKMALSIAYGVFLQSRSEPRADMPGVKYLEGAERDDLFEFYNVNRELFLDHARRLHTIVLSLGG